MTKQKKELPLWMQLQVVSSYSRGWALLLCLCGFFAIGGLHRFYVRRWISGILYLLTGGVFMVGTLYDLIQILRGEFDDDCGLHLESALRKRWDDRHAVWRYIGSTPGVGRYYINRSFGSKPGHLQLPRKNQFAGCSGYEVTWDAGQRCLWN